MYHKKNSKPAIKQTPANEPTTTPAIPPPESDFDEPFLDESPVEDADEDDEVVGDAVLLDCLSAVVDGAIVFVISTTRCRSEPVTVDTTVVGDAEGELSDDSVVDASVDEVSDLVDEAVVEGACEEELGLVELVDVFVRLVLVDDFVLVDEEEEDAACGCTSSLEYTKK